MGNWLMKCGFKRLKRNVTLLLVGLDNSGKTTAAKGIVGDDIANVVPTVGFTPMTLSYRGCKITMYDLGGGIRIRDVWTRYFAEVFGVIFVIDSSDQTRVEEGKIVLSKLLSHEKISGKPDVDGAMDEIDLVEGLDIEQVVNEHRCPTRVEMCAAINLHKKKPDKPIADGFRWLIDTIVLQYGQLEKRVDVDVENEQQIFLKELDERRERVKNSQLEREKEEREAIKITKGIDDSPSNEILIVRREDTKNYIGNVDINSAATYLPVVEDKKPLINEEEEDGSSRSPNSLEEMKELGVTSSFSSEPESTLTDGTISIVDSESPHIIYVKASTASSEPNSASDRIQLPGEKILRQESTEVNLAPAHYSNIQPDDMRQDTVVRDSPMNPQISIISTPAQFNGSVTSHIIEHLELEVSRSNRKRKPILKRLNKTAPSPTVLEDAGS